MKKWMVACSLISLLSACASEPEATLTQTPQSPISLTAPVLPGQPLTLKQVMADPDWIGNAPKGAYWGDDSQRVFYQRKQDGSKLLDRYQHPLMGSPEVLSLSQWGQVEQPGKTNTTGTLKAWLYEGNLFVRALPDGQVRQLTRDSKGWRGFRFLADGQIALWAGERVEAIDPTTGARVLLAELKFEAEPQPEQAEGFMAEQQARLIQYVAQQYRDGEQKFARDQQRQAADPTLAPKPFYLGADEQLVQLSLSPSGRYLMVAVTDKNASWRGEHDIMPNYLDKRGYVDAVPVRARVAEAQVKPHRLVVLDLTEGRQVNVTWEGLEGYDEDVLAAVKRENAEARGERYKSEKALRTIRLMEDWGWKQSAMVWHPTEDKLAVMLEAADNKDRWLASVDLAKGTLATEHRLHDDAWVNYTHNEFGWLGADRLYYLSEESGFSNLYVKPLGGKARALTSGRQVVSSLTLSDDQRHFYFKANPNHPGQYEVFRVAVESGQIEQLTDLKGMLEYQLSPDESALLLEYSSLTRPEELYVQPLGGEARQLTHTAKAEFLSYDWQAPQVVAVPSSHQADPVYARVYLPKGFDPAKRYPAVIFNHGAGYLQNAHFGWSGYFREFMFHNLLAQQGYVVMDMDYRGSKGYGRDWRTAIYRQMGTPEVQDLADGVNWMAENVAVDRSRVGTYGGSYGGFMTFMALFTQPELFQSGAALRPVTDWAHYNHPYTSNILNTPQVDPIAYQRSSPIEHAEGLQKPLLIMAGVLDDNVFFQDSVRLVQRLIELEKPMFETAIYPIEPHGFREPSSWLDEYRRIHRLFEDTLK
ncbi:prolyl oligopeptidase family serine peptidase [Ferrimonas balearica]|uniref:prolyl oligopeptidase family serine peptidase n=1 Tax=Ferrimonas balearica TaxID=44012 RepID=UPI001C99DB4F|nr:prolyl oligopeptidase family serine peptidase [Ferrimonas balearica]MBY5922439.1 prolyl oligopeptidase family serine peptidase [Ferrimonas balearica]MBY5995423.1 prolyl oligopeptidase family serine peptidase [Ferrimonas balearica]